MLYARAGHFNQAFETMTLALSLAQEAGEQAHVCEAEFRGGFFAVQVGELASAHDLLDNAEWHAAELGDELRLGFTRVVRGVALLAEGETEEAVEWIEDGVRRIGAADAFDRAFVLRQYARVLIRAGRHGCAVPPLTEALASALQRDDHTQLADCLETFAALEPACDEAARALGAAQALRVRGSSVRWADERDDAAAALASVRARVGYDRAADLAAEGRGDPDGVTHAVLDLLAA